MSDVEIIRLIRSSGSTLLATPTGVLSIISHYSRPNVFTFSETQRTYTTWHCSIEGSYSEQTLECSYSTNQIIGCVKDTIYLRGYSSKHGWCIFSFDIGTRAFRHLWRVDNVTAMCHVSAASMYMCEPTPDRKMFGFQMYDLVTGRKKGQATVINPRYDHKSFLHNGSVYILGGDDKGKPTAKCERFDINERKWVLMSPMPLPAKGISVVAKDGCIYLITSEGYSFMYNPEKNTWTTLKLDEAFAKLPLESLQYNKGKFIAITRADNSNPTMILEVDSTTPERPWQLVSTIGVAGRCQGRCTYLHLIDK